MAKSAYKTFGRSNTITPLESAAILIALLIVASVFAFTIVSAGMLSSADGFQIPYTGTQTARSLKLHDNVLATSSHPERDRVDALVFSLGLEPGCDSIDMTDTGDLTDGSQGDATVMISYRDRDNEISGLEWSVEWIKNGRNPHDTTVNSLLEEGELAEITVWLASTDLVSIPAPLQANLAASTQFAIDVTLPTGSAISVVRQTPASLTAVMDLR